MIQFHSLSRIWRDPQANALYNVLRQSPEPATMLGRVRNCVLKLAGPATIALALAVTSMAAPKPSIMAVFAHPDDETSAGPLLARYARLGHKVYLVTITSGQLGTNPNTTLRGDALGTAREEETRCAANGLGIEPPVLLRYFDQGISAPPVMEEIAAKLRELIDRLRPEVLITWGPDGLTGHQDHRATGNIVSQVFQQHGKLTFRPSRLYYVAWPESVLAAAPPPFNGPGFGRAVADDLITTAIDCAKDTPAAYKAISCHKTQWDSATMKHFDEMNVKVLAGKIYLREAYAAKRGNRKEPDLFPRR